MAVVPHEAVTGTLNVVSFERLGEDLEIGATIPIVFIYAVLSITATHDVIRGAAKPDTGRSGHIAEDSRSTPALFLRFAQCY
jgi:hypothetical protein